MKMESMKLTLALVCLSFCCVNLITATNSTWIVVPMAKDGGHGPPVPKTWDSMPKNVHGSPLPKTVDPMPKGPSFNYTPKAVVSTKEDVSKTSRSTCEPCGTINPTTRIVGGQGTGENEYPWMACMTSPGGNFCYCGASLLNDRWLVTAAYCVTQPTPTDILLGAHSLSTPATAQQRIPLKQVLQHQGYDPNTLNHNIALLELSNPANLNDNVKPICLPDPNKDYANVDAIITGWGTLTAGGSQPDILHAAKVPTMTNANCNVFYYGYILNIMICAGILVGGKDVCQFDTGGPLAVEDNGSWVLVGITSWAGSCGRSYTPGVYNRVSPYVSLIQGAISSGGNNLCPATTTSSTTSTSTTSTSTTSTSTTSTSTTSTSTTSTSTTTSSSGCNCGKVNRATRIVGGVETEVNEYPWQVGIITANTKNNDVPFCGGSIICDRWILTAAHCAEVMDTTNIIVIGEHNTAITSETTHTQRRSIKQIFLNPNYNISTVDNDMALVELMEPITFLSDNKVAPVCLPPAGPLYDNVDAVTSGWGNTQSGGSQSTVLIEVTVPTMNNTMCNTLIGGITDNMICAGEIAGGKDSCQGDSGGPLVTYADTAKTYMELIGITSWGHGCGDPNSPGVYARVTKYLSWISTTTGGCNSCPPPS